MPIRANVRRFHCSWGHWITADLQGRPRTWTLGNVEGWSAVASMAALDAYAALFAQKVEWTVDAARNCGEPECPHCVYTGPLHVWV
jgi:hypothetical protein